MITIVLYTSDFVPGKLRMFSDTVTDDGALAVKIINNVKIVDHHNAIYATADTIAQAEREVRFYYLQSLIDDADCDEEEAQKMCDEIICMY